MLVLTSWLPLVLIGFCIFNITNNLMEFIKKETDGDTNFAVTPDGKTLILPDRTRKPIPRDLNCNECWTKIAKISFDYFDAHRLDERLEQNIFGGYEQMKQEFND